MKKTLASWLASRAEQNARRIRRDLRDHTRSELTAAARADKRARGLRLYAAWSTPKPATATTIEAAFDEIQRRLGTPACPSGLNIERTREVLGSLSLQPSTFNLQPSR